MTGDVDDPHAPTPREHELPDGDLAVSSHWVHGVQGAVTVEADDRPLYRLLMRILGDKWVPDLMPAHLATACRDFVDVKQRIEKIDSGRADIGGVGWGMGYCHTVRDAIEDHRASRPGVQLVLVGCSGSKRDVDRAVARDLYSSPYWSCKRQYAEAVTEGPDDWRICSAEHAVLDPLETIEYYERTPDDLEGVPVDSDRELPNGEPVETLLDRWALEVHDGLAAWLDDVAGGLDPCDVELTVLLGHAYEDPLRDRDVFDALPERHPGALALRWPFREVDGLEGIGDQQAWLSQQAAAAADGGEPVA